MKPAGSIRAAALARPSAPGFSFTKLLIDVTLARLVLAATTLIAPFRGLVALQLFLGRSCHQLTRDLLRWLLRTVGWLAATPQSRLLRRPGGALLDVRRWHYAAAALAIYSSLAAAIRAWRLLHDQAHQQKRRLLAKMSLSRSYFEWSINAAKLDALEGVDQQERWRQETRLYDRQLLREKVQHLRKVRECGSVGEQMFAVRADLLRNLGHMTNSALHQHFPVVPEAIREYIEEVRGHLEEIARCPELPLDERAAFLKETRHAFGRTALLLAGGGPLAAFHLGVARALAEHQLLPRVLAGSGSGALVCALLATRSDVELQARGAHGEVLGSLHTFDLTFLCGPTCGLLSRLVPWRGGGAEAAAAREGVLRRLRHLLGDLTFLEAFRHTGRVLNVCVGGGHGAEPPRLLNYLTVGAGGGGDVRIEMFSVNHFIVSQASPVVVPMLNAKLRAGWEGAVGEAELKHRCRQLDDLLGGWLPGHRLMRRVGGPWEGDVTIVPPAGLLVPLLGRALLGRPSQAGLMAAVRQLRASPARMGATLQGELCAWAKLSAIQSNCGIEATLDACIQQVVALERQQHRAAAGALQPLKARIPSWMHLPALAGAAGSPPRAAQLLHAAQLLQDAAACGAVGAGGGVSKSASADSLLSAGGCSAVGWGAGGEGAGHRWWLDASFEFDASEDHLPLPEERPYRRPGSSQQQHVFRPAATLECTDASVAGISLDHGAWAAAADAAAGSPAAGGVASQAAPAAGAPAGKALDVIAP
eukprot:scaffold14.g1278.t1